MTSETPIGDALQPPAPAQPAQPQQLSFLGHLHRDLSHIGQAVEHAWPIIRSVATNPRLDELLDAALTADGLGVAAEVFQAATDSLRAAAERKAQPATDGQVPITAPQPIAPVAPTSPQPIITETVTDPGSVFTPNTPNTANAGL